MGIRKLFRRILAAGVSILSLSVFAPAAFAMPQSGWWWNPEEPGRGFFMEIVGDWMFLSGYFYDADGRPTWLVSNDPMPDENYYRGRLLEVRNGQTLVGDYRAPQAPVAVGDVTVQFDGNDRATLTWPGGSVPIERYNFMSENEGRFRPFTGWWWNPAESGRGFAVEVQGEHMFVAAYLYDDAGNPVRYVADGMMSAPKQFTGALLRFANGQTMGGEYRAPGAPQAVGTITIDFSGPDRATVTLSEDAPAKGGRSKMIVIEPQKKKPIPERPKRFTGTISQKISYQGKGHLTMTWSGTVTWVRFSGRDEELASLDGSAFYEIESTDLTLDYSLYVPGEDGGEPCSASENRPITPTASKLVVGTDGRYNGYVYSKLGFVGTCKPDVKLPEILTIEMKGSMVYNVIKDKTNEGTIMRFTTDWNFSAKP